MWYVQGRKQMQNPVTSFKPDSLHLIFVTGLIILLLVGITFSHKAHATCNPNLTDYASSCSSFNIKSYINTNNKNIRYVNNKSKTIFGYECLSHQLCYDDTNGTKKVCDTEFISEIKYQCKVNFGRLYIAKQKPKRIRKCLKTVKKACGNFNKNCGQTCLIYGTDNIAVQQITEYIKNPIKSDYLLSGAVFYPNSNYQACLSVVKGYQSVLSKQVKKSKNRFLAENSEKSRASNCP